MELASTLKRMGLQRKDDCAKVTLETVQYYHEESISPTGRKLLEKRFSIRPKTGAKKLDSGKCRI